ncbi:MAG: hypothetical protein NXH80_12370 [Rhodobacteraceae bacterium]|nr:hypothetical protein [Paracoccaceae bacterium]
MSDLFTIRDSESARSEMRQFLLSMACFAFVLAALGAGQVGADAFAKDIILVFCGGWCANQLIRGPEIFKSQVICVLQAYFIGVLCCALLLFVVGWMIFLPEEYKHLGHALVLAATFTTNFGLVFFPVDSGLRFDGLFDHLWIPALIAQCGIILTCLYLLFARNIMRLLAALVGLASLSLLVSLIDNAVVQILPIGGLWAFLFGAIPFIITNRFRVLEYASLIGVIALLLGVLVISAAGDTLVARALIAMGLAFLYLGSRPRASMQEMSDMRRRWFGMVLHTFLWAVPLTKLNAALSISGHFQSHFMVLVVPCLLFAIFSWTIWQHFEQRNRSNQIVISAVVAAVLLINGLIGLATQGLQLRFPEGAQAYIHALDSKEPAFSCSRATDGPLAGLEVCRLGPAGPPQVLVWGDHQLDAIRVGFAEAARRAQVPTLLIAKSNCIPLDSLQSRFPANSAVSGQECDQQSAQVLQALSHLKSIRQVTLVADWTYYLEIAQTELFVRPKVRLGPLDGSPFDITRQAEYVAGAAKTTIEGLRDKGLRVSVLRQVPSHPSFDAEMAARSSLPGVGLYFGMPNLSTSIDLAKAAERHAPLDQLFKGFATTGLLTYVDTWGAFCSSTRCDVRGGLSSDYVTSTRLSPSGALALAPILESDLKRALTHAPYRRNLDS